MIYIIGFFLVIAIIAFIMIKKIKAKEGNYKLTINMLRVLLVVCILVILLFIVGIIKIMLPNWASDIALKNDVAKFEEEAKNYEYIYEYDYSKDVEKYGHITEEGAVKITKEASKKDKIANYKCTLKENEEYYKVSFLNNTENQNNEENSNKGIATFYLVEIETGVSINQNQRIKYMARIDYYTGEILTIDCTDLIEY